MNLLRTIKHILKGWAKAIQLIKTTETEAKMSQLRLKVCNRNLGICAKHSTWIKIANGAVGHESGLQCTMCGCPCLEKSLVAEETCPLDKWKN